MVTVRSSIRGRNASSSTSSPYVKKRSVAVGTTDASGEKVAVSAQPTLLTLLLLLLPLLLTGVPGATASILEAPAVAAATPANAERLLSNDENSNDGGGLLRLAGYETSSRISTSSTSSQHRSTPTFWSQSIQSQSLSKELELEHVQIELMSCLESYDFEKATTLFQEKFKLMETSTSKSSLNSRSRIDDLFLKYYGRPDYSDEWILAALDGRSSPTASTAAAAAATTAGETDTQGGDGDDFGLLSADGRAAAIQTATITMQSLTMISRWMMNMPPSSTTKNNDHQKQQELDVEGAIDVCSRECSHTNGIIEYKISGLHDTICTQAAEHWDHAVAVFVGPSSSGRSDSVTGTGNGGSYGGDDGGDQYDYHGHDGHRHGHMLYSLMGRYAHEFHYDRSEQEDRQHHHPAGTVRHMIMKLFTEGQDSLWESDCHRTEVLMDEILKLFIVVLVQGVLKNSWFLDENNIIKDDDDDDDLDTFWGEGAAFTKSLLPMLNECSATDAKKLEDMMEIRKSKGPTNNHHERQVDYEEVFSTLERNYKCLGISKDMIGRYDGPDIDEISEGERSSSNDDFVYAEYDDDEDSFSSTSSTSLSSSSLRSNKKSTASESFRKERSSYNEESTSGIFSIASLGVVVIVFGLITRRKIRLRSTSVKINDGMVDTLASRRERRRQHYLNHDGRGEGAEGMIRMVELTSSRFSASLSSLNATSIPFLDDNDDKEDEYSDESEDLNDDDLREVSRSANRIAMMGESGRSLVTGGMRRRSNHGGLLDDSMHSALSLSASSFHG